MFDRELALEQLVMLEVGCSRIAYRIAKIDNPGAFDSIEGQETLDSIGMVIIGIGDLLKTMDKHFPAELFAAHPEVDWKKAKAMRDRLSHGYFFLDKDIVFDSAKNEFPLMLEAAKAMRARLEQESDHGPP